MDTRIGSLSGEEPPGGELAGESSTEARAGIGVSPDAATSALATVPSWASSASLERVAVSWREEFASSGSKSANSR